MQCQHLALVYLDDQSVHGLEPEAGGRPPKSR